MTHPGPFASVEQIAWFYHRLNEFKSNQFYTIAKRDKMAENKKVNLFQIEQRAVELLSKIEFEEGEVTPESETELLAVISQMDDADALLWWMRRKAKDRIQDCAETIEIFRHQKGRAQDKLDWVNGTWMRLLQTREDLGKEPKARGSWGTAYISKGAEKVEITNPDTVGLKYRKETVTETIDKSKLLKDLKAGIKCKGARTIRNPFLSVRSK
jgi:hypothetical protein